MAKHDENFRRLFQNAAMWRSLIGGFGTRLGLPAAWVERFDLDHIRAGPTELVSQNLTVRRLDLVLRIPLLPDPEERSEKPGARGGGAPACTYALIAVEFQSEPDPDMPKRTEEYAQLLREYARRAEPDEPPPLIISLVVHTGPDPWNVPRDTARLQPPFAPEDIDRLLGTHRHLVLDIRTFPADDLPVGEPMSRLIQIMQASSRKELLAALTAAIEEGPTLLLRSDFYELVRHLRWHEQYGELPPFNEFEKARGDEMARGELLADYNARMWGTRRRQRALRLGARLGHKQGLAEGVAEGRAEGVAEGRAEGVAEGLERERALLRRLAALRFGDQISNSFAALLEQVDDFDRLDEIGELILACETAEELLARANGTR